MSGKFLTLIALVVKNWYTPLGPMKVIQHILWIKEIHHSPWVIIQKEKIITPHWSTLKRSKRSHSSGLKEANHHAIISSMVTIFITPQEFRLKGRIWKYSGLYKEYGILLKEWNLLFNLQSWIPSVGWFDRESDVV